MISSLDPWVAGSQLNLYVFPDEFMYPSEHLSRHGPIEVEGEDLLVEEKILDNRKKNLHHHFLVHWIGYRKHEATWQPLTHLAGSQELVKEYWYQEHKCKVPFKLSAMARKSTSDFVAQLPAMYLMDSELKPVGFWDAMHDSKYQSKTETGYTMDTTSS
jgi:hypothetical protein